MNQVPIESAFFNNESSCKVQFIKKCERQRHEDSFIYGKNVVCLHTDNRHSTYVFLLPFCWSYQHFNFENPTVCYC